MGIKPREAWRWARLGMKTLALILGFFLFLPAVALAAEPTVEVEVGTEKRSFTRDELLARPDAATVEVPKEVTTGAPMSFRAVPAAALNTDASKSTAWVAIEPADHPWPKVPGKDYTAGPFYVVWTKPEASGIRSEYWAYQLAKLQSQLLPEARWPALAVDQALPADDPARAGQILFIAQCLPCHKMNGGGASDMGGDLNLPMNATEYMTDKGLHALIRDPKSVRSWPGMKMQGLPPDLLSDQEIDRIIAYLKHMAGGKVAP